MQKIILDTNVIVSALIGRSAPAQILEELVLKAKVEVILSDPVWQEYMNVLQREKFAKFPDFRTQAELVLAYLDVVATQFQPVDKVDLIADASDNKFLELAKISNAHFLITGNINDFSMIRFGSTHIITPADYWQNHKPV